MKTLNWAKIWLLSILLFGIVSCSENEDNDVERIEVICIAPKLEQSGTMPPTDSH